MKLMKNNSPLSTFWREVHTFGIIGILNLIIDLGLFNILTHSVLIDRVTTAKIVSGLTATIFAWFGNRYWTFRHRENRKLHHEVLLFFIVNGLALLVTTGWVAFAHYSLHAHSILWLNINAIIGIALGTIIRFIAYRKIVFGKAAEAGI